MSNNCFSSFHFDALDHFAYIAMLYDFYKPLLTEKQSAIIEMHFMNDLSLSEIGNELGISRQAGSILINRTERILRNYEEKLGLVKKHMETGKSMDAIVAGLREVAQGNGISMEAKEKIEKAINDISEEFSRGV